MEFNAVGSSMASGLNPYGGIVYAYTTDSIMFWIPKAEKGHLIYIGGIWGSGQQSESADVVDVNVVVYYLSGKSKSFVFILHLFTTATVLILSNKGMWYDCKRNLLNRVQMFKDQQSTLPSSPTQPKNKC